MWRISRTEESGAFEKFGRSEESKESKKSEE
jgi:hypothetical protein